MGISAVLAVATAAGASVLHGRGEPSAAVGADHALVSGVQNPAEPVAAVVPQQSPEAEVGAAKTYQTGRAEAGRVEKADTVLGYLDGKKSATLRYPGAEFVKVHFSQLVLLPGDYLTVSDPARTEVHRIEGDAVGSVLGTAGRWAMSVTGDTALVELHTGALDLLGLGGAVDRLGVVIDKVTHGYTEAERDAASESYRLEKKKQARTGREETVCANDDKADAVCYRSTDPVVYRRSKAVARMLIDGVELCTAWRVGPTNRLLTNNHCVADREQAADVEVWFNYQCAECGGYAVFRPTKVWLDQLITTDKTLDYSLFSVTDFDLVQKFGYLELDLRRPAPGEELYIPQHPAGAPAMVALTSDRDRAGNCAIQDDSYDGYDEDTDVSYYCDTEGGSSGSPVISRRTNKVVALHHFGGCPNSGVRLELIYQQISGKL
ncbi:serine protease [Catellatospora sp. KI3]|uniref:trypsin-like serine peptidase n=1 Tax=Catellatospora sp. KI3 TaxID=3041620 RepID=UPI002482195E|nr:serine protease [Catellatospora sp. KI3]MDI1465833.1 serine protease [Catellatospora sp. KI3]